MKNIEFRGIPKNESEYVYGSLLIIPAPLTCFGQKLEDTYQIVYEDPNTCPDWGMPRQMIAVDVDKNSVGQYTYLRDSYTGEKIYEGDIITVVGYSYMEPEIDACGEIILTSLGWVLIDAENHMENIKNLQGSYTTTYSIQK